MIDPTEIIQRWRETLGDVYISPVPIYDKSEIVFRWVGWFFKSKMQLLEFPIWVGPYEFKEQAERACDKEAAGL